MIGRLPVVALILISIPAVVSSQSDGKAAPQTLASLACPAESGPPSKAPHKWVAMSAGMMARDRTGGRNPKYPSDAKKARIEGTVVLMAMISASGEVEDLCVVQGPAMLQKAAVDAVRKWKYKPIVLNGQPAEVKTQINVVFSL